MGAIRSRGPKSRLQFPLPPDPAPGCCGSVEESVLGLMGTGSSWGCWGERVVCLQPLSESGKSNMKLTHTEV